MPDLDVCSLPDIGIKMKLLDEDLVYIRDVSKWYARKTHQEADELVNIAVIEILAEKEYVIAGERKDLIRTIATNAIKEFLREGRPMIKIPTRSSTRHELSDIRQNPADPQDFVTSKSMGPEETVTIEDSLLHAAHGPMEKAYIRLRIAGLTNPEAIAELDISTWKASTMLRAIEERFREEWDE